MKSGLCLFEMTFQRPIRSESPFRLCVFFEKHDIEKPLMRRVETGYP